MSLSTLNPVYSSGEVVSSERILWRINATFISQLGVSWLWHDLTMEYRKQCPSIRDGDICRHFCISLNISSLPPISRILKLNDCITIWITSMGNHGVVMAVVVVVVVVVGGGGGGISECRHFSCPSSTKFYCVVSVALRQWDNPIPVKVTLDISRSPIESQWGSWKYPG